MEEIGEGDDGRLDGSEAEDREALGDDVDSALGWILVDEGMINGPLNVVILRM